MNDPKTAEPPSKRTLVEEGTEFKGTFSSTCPILVRGKVIGDVIAPSLEISATGAVHGRVKVGQIRSQGELSGEIEAELVQLSGTVKDKTVVRAKSLEVKLASPSGRMQVVFGECVLDVGEAPSKEAALASGARDARTPSASIAPPAVNGSVRPSMRPSEREASNAPPSAAPGQPESARPLERGQVGESITSVDEVVVDRASAAKPA
jgi:cytoskeletal protein CcmA (bactofilin family)